MSERRTMYAVHLRTLLLVAQLSHCAAKMNCPELGYIGSEASITCIGANTTHAYSKPSGSTASTCGVTSQHCIDTGDDTGTVINATQTVLTISSVKQSDAGEWECTRGSESTPSKCSMAVANVPRCSIGSDKNADTLALHEDLALTVDIQEYYCSAQYSFMLLVGEVIVQLPVSESVNKPTDKTATTIVNVTDKSLGVVQLVFRCHNVEQNLSCDGVKFINVLPRCSITSGKTSNAVKLHEELDLTVDIQDYFCSASYNITLQVGDVSHALSTSQIGTRLTKMSVNTTLNVTDSNFGDVRLIFFCHDQHQVLTCQGLQSIKESTASTSTPSTSTPSTSAMLNTRIIAAVVSFIVIVVVSLTAVGCCYRHRVKQSHHTHTSDNQSDLPNEAVENPAYNKSTFNENILY
ncbi:uncharacterized protein [Haliotis cracherodii]|uniref:uncharacterized protein isoform X2 n=1 Tax=Haliotis cracherodii TaxID=6455 RepID=UPI0039E850D7